MTPQNKPERPPAKLPLFLLLLTLALGLWTLDLKAQWNTNLGTNIVTGQNFNTNLGTNIANSGYLYKTNLGTNITGSFNFNTNLPNNGRFFGTAVVGYNATGAGDTRMNGNYYPDASQTGHLDLEGGPGTVLAGFTNAGGAFLQNVTNEANTGFIGLPLIYPGLVLYQTNTFGVGPWVINPPGASPGPTVTTTNLTLYLPRF